MHKQGLPWLLGPQKHQRGFQVRGNVGNTGPFGHLLGTHGCLERTKLSGLDPLEEQKLQGHAQLILLTKSDKNSQDPCLDPEKTNLVTVFTVFRVRAKNRKPSFVTRRRSCRYRLIRE
jgi:hypothetical protein